MNIEEKKLFRNTFLYTLGGIGTKIITYILVPLYTAYLRPEEYGAVDVFYLSIQILVTVGSLKIASSLVRFVLTDKQNAVKYFTNASIVVVVSCTYCVLFYRIFFLKDFIKYDLNVGIFLIFFLSFGLRELGYELSKAIDRNDIFVIDGFVYSVSLLLLSLWLIVDKRLGAMGYVSSYILSNIISCLFLSISLNLKKYLRFNQISITIIKKMLKYSFFLVPATLSFWIVQASDRFMVKYIMGDKYAGIYGVAYKIPSICGSFISFFNSAWFVSAVSNENNKDFYSKIYDSYFRVIVSVTGLIILFCRPIAHILFRGEYYSAWVYLPLLLYGMIFQYLFSFFEMILLSLKNTISVMTTVVIGALVNVILNYIFIYQVGVMGAVVASMISYFFVFILRIILLISKNTLDIKLKDNFFLFLLLLLLAVLMMVNSREIYYISVVITITIFIYNKKVIYNIISLLKSKFGI